MFIVHCSSKKKRKHFVNDETDNNQIYDKINAIKFTLFSFGKKQLCWLDLAVNLT